MADRINGMRAELKNKLVNDLDNKNNWDHITNQIGMFAFLGISPEQVAKLSKDHHVYLTKDGSSFVLLLSYNSNALYRKDIGCWYYQPELRALG